MIVSTAGPIPNLRNENWNSLLLNVSTKIRDSGCVTYITTFHDCLVINVNIYWYSFLTKSVLSKHLSILSNNNNNNNEAPWRQCRFALLVRRSVYFYFVRLSSNVTDFYSLFHSRCKCLSVCRRNKTPTRCETQAKQDTHHMHGKGLAGKVHSSATNILHSI